MNIYNGLDVVSHLEERFADVRHCFGFCCVFGIHIYITIESLKVHIAYLNAVCDCSTYYTKMCLFTRAKMMVNEKLGNMKIDKKRHSFNLCCACAWIDRNIKSMSHSDFRVIFHISIAQFESFIIIFSFIHQYITAFDNHCWPINYISLILSLSHLLYLPIASFIPSFPFYRNISAIDSNRVSFIVHTSFL